MLNLIVALPVLFGFISCASKKEDKLRRVGLYQLTEEEKERYSQATMYYIPTISYSTSQDCSASDIVSMRNRDGKPFASVCRKAYRSCLMQGTCRLEVKQGSRFNKILLNVGGRLEDGAYAFKDVTSHDCQFGIGNATDRFRSYSKMCLEPYYSVAADLSIYNLGDVIYMPILKGVKLPNGKIHDGYVIVRDSGQKIKGRGRFDFFTGFSPVNKDNAFYKVGLSGGVHYPEYYVIEGYAAERIRIIRNFPMISIESPYMLASSK